MTGRNGMLRALSAAAVLLLLGMTESRGQGAGPVIEPVRDTIICPPIKVGEEEILPFDSIFTNAGDADLVISNISVVAGDTDEFFISPLTIYPLTIPAGETIGLVIHFQPDRNGDRMATIRVESNDPARPTLDMLVIGMGATPAIRGRDVDFGTVPGGEKPDTVVRGIVQNIGPIPLVIEEITILSSAVYIIDPVPLPVSLDPGDSFDLRLRYDPLIVGQEVVDSIRIESTAVPSPLYVKVTANTTNGVEERGSPVGSLRLLSNPAHGRVEGVVELGRGGPMRLTVTDGRGTEVYRREYAWLGAGDHPLTWEGTGPDNTRLPSGLYYLRITTGVHTYTHPVILLR